MKGRWKRWAENKESRLRGKLRTSRKIKDFKVNSVQKFFYLV